MRFIVFLIFILSTSSIWAQQNNSGESGWQIGAQIGRLLPNKVDGASEILPLWGARIGYDFGTNFILEAGNASGDEEGVTWNNFYLSFRTNMDIQDLTGTVYLGFDGTKYTGTDGESHFVGGNHVGGGLLADLGKYVQLRLDMKFNIKPATSLYIAGGLQFHF
ncbi:MAG: hypothetical protein MK008_00560 [Bdellovibrionales bacterium]|nr:hypothetical protein [Bdellovibrionales bacterium]